MRWWVTIWPFVISVAKSAGDSWGKMGKLLAPISPQLQKDPHINSPQTPPSLSSAALAAFIGPFSPDLILAIQNGVICCRFYDPPASLCFAINSRYEGRANKTAIVRAILAITPDKPLPKCPSASSKSNQIIKQQIWNFTSADQPRIWTQKTMKETIHSSIILNALLC